MCFSVLLSLPFNYSCLILYLGREMYWRKGRANILLKYSSECKSKCKTSDTFWNGIWRHCRLKIKILMESYILGLCLYSFSVATSFSRSQYIAGWNVFLINGICKFVILYTWIDLSSFMATPFPWAYNMSSLYIGRSDVVFNFWLFWTILQF